jgi:hypothetical protein
MLAFLFVLYTIAYAEQSAQTNGGDMVNLLEKGAQITITAMNMQQNQTSDQSDNNQNQTSSDQFDDQGMLWVRMWFDKLEEIEPSNKTVVFSIDDLATTDFELTPLEEVDFDAQTRATRFNFSASLSNGARLFISVFPKFTSLKKNGTEGGNSTQIDDDSSSSPIDSPVQSSPVQSSPVQSSPVQSSPVQSSPVQSSPVDQQSSPVSPVQPSSPVQNSGQAIQAPGLDVDDDDKNRSSETGTRQTMLADGTAVPFSAIKFSVWLTGWPFVDKANKIRLGAILTSSDNGTATLEGRDLHMGSGWIHSKKEAFYDGAKGPVSTEIYHKDDFHGLTWTFQSFENELMYDPVFGYQSGAFHILPSITTILLLLMIGLIRS